MQMSLWRNADRNIIQLAHWPQCAPLTSTNPLVILPISGWAFWPSQRQLVARSKRWPHDLYLKWATNGHSPYIHTHTCIEWLVQTFIANCRKDICINLTKPKVFHVGKQTNDNLTTHTHKCTGQQASSRRWAVVARRGRGTCNLPANRADHQHPKPTQKPHPSKTINMIQFANCTNFSWVPQLPVYNWFPPERTLLNRFKWPKYFRLPFSIIRKPFAVK